MLIIYTCTCSIYTLIASSLPLYIYILLTPTINYLHVFNRPMYDSLHSIPRYYIYIYMCVYTPWNSLHTLPINETSTAYSCTNTDDVGLLLLGTPPGHRGGEGETFWLGGRMYRLFLYMCTYMYMYLYMYIHSYICTCLYLNIHTYIQTYRHTYITYITYIHTHIHTYIYIYVYTHIYILECE